MMGDWVFTTAPHKEGGLLCMLQTKEWFLWCRCALGREQATLLKLLNEARAS